MKRIVLVGSGITGLSTALHLKDGAAALHEGLDVVVLESRDRPGGNIRTDRPDGFRVEMGPNGFLDNAPATLALVDRLGLTGELERANENAARRFIYRNGRLHEVPTGPIGFLRSGVLSLGGRVRVFGEPFARPRPQGKDESVYDFAARRIGPEAAGVLVDAMVSGVFAGNVRELSLQSSFPKMAKMEAEHGGLVKAMVAGMKKRRAAKKEAEARRARGEDVAELTAPGGPAGPGGTLTSFRDGLDTLVRGLADAVGDSLRTDAPVASIRRAGDGRWEVVLEGGEALDADAVVVTTPAPPAVPLLDGVDAELASTVGEIRTAGLAVVALGFRRADLAGVDLEGFGFLVPRGTGPRILGCLWDSSVFPGRAPEGKVLLRCMIGGAHDPDAVSAPDESLLRQVRHDLELTMGIALDIKPVLTRIYRWPLGIGQYTLGHQDRLDRIHARLAGNQGLWVAGSSFYGISMNACFEKASRQVTEILAYLAR